MTFDIRDFLDQLEPDGGRNDPRGDHSYKCPVCGASNFKVNVQTGKWAAFGCDCSYTETGKRRIREALSPATRPDQRDNVPSKTKAIRPKAQRSWTYADANGRLVLEVLRADDGNGNRRIWQRSNIPGKQPREVAASVVPYGRDAAQQALKDGTPYIFFVEGEPCVDALRQLGLTAVCSLGGCDGFDPERDGGHFDPARVVVVPDRDECGVKYARAVAAAYPGCLWMLPFPGTPQWNGAMPRDGGLDVGDWIEAGASIEQVMGGIQREDPFPKADSNVESSEPLDLWEAYLKELVDPSRASFERNLIRRQIRAQTKANALRLRVSPEQVRARLIQKQRDLIAGSEEKGVRGGTIAEFAEKQWLISGLIAMGCLTGIAAFAKVGKTKLLAELAAALIFQRPFMGNPEWQPAPGEHKLILWWTDQPGVDSAAYLKALGLMGQDGALHPLIVKLYTEEDGLCWDDQGMDELIQITSANPGSVVLSDSFYRNVQPVYGSDQAPEAGGALIDVQTYLSKNAKAHVCSFHSPQETGPVGVAAMRGHGSAKGVPSAVISLHFLERKDPATGKWVADKENPHRRMVTEGRLPFADLLVHLDGATGVWKVLGEFQKGLAALTADDRKASQLERLTEDQRQTLEWVGSASGTWRHPKGVTVAQVARLKAAPDEPSHALKETVRKQLNACHRRGLLTKSKVGTTDYFAFQAESVDG